MLLCFRVLQGGTQDRMRAVPVSQFYVPSGDTISISQAGKD
jgi:hypothetical protein